MTALPRPTIKDNKNDKLGSRIERWIVAGLVGNGLPQVVRDLENRGAVRFLAGFSVTEPGADVYVR